MAKMYAWSSFRLDVDEHNKAKKVIEPGEEVTAEKLKVSKEEFENLIEVGAVRDLEYPPVEPGQSPAEYFRSAAAERAEMTPKEMKALMAFKDSQGAQVEPAIVGAAAQVQAQADDE
jgi:hypothetical protein